MSAAERIADCEARTRRAEDATFILQIRLAIVREKMAGLEAAENKRQKVLIQTAAAKLVKDAAGQFFLAEQFASDPSLIPLALTKRIFRAGQKHSQRTNNEINHGRLLGGGL